MNIELHFEGYRGAELTVLEMEGGWPFGLATCSHFDQVTCITQSAARVLSVKHCALNVLLNLQEMLFIFS